MNEKNENPVVAKKRRNVIIMCFLLLAILIFLFATGLLANVTQAFADFWL